MKYRNCELSHMEYHTDKTGMSYDMGWCMVFKGESPYGGPLTIMSSVENKVVEHRDWLRKLNEDFS